MARSTGNEARVAVVKPFIRGVTMRKSVVRLFLSSATLACFAACGADDGSGSRVTAGSAGSSNTTSSGTATGGAGGASSGGTSGASGSGASGGSGGTSNTTGSGGGAGTGGTTGTGSTSGSGGAGGTTGKGGNAGSGGAVDAGTPTDARGSSDASGTRDSSDARADIVTADTDDVDATRPDVSTGDAGLPPYKGVANSECVDQGKLGSTWFYNWTLSGTCATSQFIPMLWGHTGNEQTAGGISNAMNTLVAKGFTTVLGFNEPDNTGQSNMTVAAAIALWPSFNNPALRIGSPATSANANGQTWFKDFMAQVNSDTTGTLRVDFLALHWYGWNAGSCESNASSLESYIKTMEAIPGNRPIWITEWGA
jgi:hypothetical protein